MLTFVNLQKNIKIQKLGKITFGALWLHSGPLWGVSKTDSGTAPGCLVRGGHGHFFPFLKKLDQFPIYGGRDILVHDWPLWQSSKQKEEKRKKERKKETGKRPLFHGAKWGGGGVFWHPLHIHAWLLGSKWNFVKAPCVIFSQIHLMLQSRKLLWQGDKDTNPCVDKWYRIIMIARLLKGAKLRARWK